MTPLGIITTFVMAQFIAWVLLKMIWMLWVHRNDWTAHNYSGARRANQLQLQNLRRQAEALDAWKVDTANSMFADFIRAHRRKIEEPSGNAQEPRR